MNFPVRKRTRLKNYDYSANGYYFITICSLHRGNLFSFIDEKDVMDTVVGATCGRPKLKPYGEIVLKEINKPNSIYENVKVNNFIIMPDHIHLIIAIDDYENGRPKVAPTLSQIINQFKGSISKQIGKAIWQKGFYDRVIRNQFEYENAWNYVEYNALKQYFKKTK